MRLQTVFKLALATETKLAATATLNAQTPGAEIDAHSHH